ASETKRIPILRTKEVSAYGACQPDISEKDRRTAQTHCGPASKPPHYTCGIANVYSCGFPGAPFHITCCHRQGGCIRTRPQAVLASGPIDLAGGATNSIRGVPRSFFAGGRQ